MDAEELHPAWDEEKYRLLNAHFRQQINTLLRTDTYLADAVAGGKSLQLQELIGRMTEKDQRLWQEFLALDRIKLHLDMKDHLEGRGTPFSPRTGFQGPSGTKDDIGDAW
ncbi:hypothetical protein GCM10023188_18300 [Pontibacter saemangeumensis]|uniref:Uncharacterized protein n=1 Tax=Pontibacter saemangeumensis TaxID=1084525 RepID=A0ABP8LLJ6_9BACT